MQYIQSISDLDDAIFRLEQQQKEERRLLREELHSAQQSLKPANLIKGIFHDVSSSSAGLKQNIVNTSIGLLAGYLSKKLVVKVSRNPFKNLVGNALMFGITNVVAKHPDTVRSVGSGIFRGIKQKLSRKKRSNGHIEHIDAW